MLILFNTNYVVSEFDIFPNRYAGRLLITVQTNRDNQLGVFYDGLYGEKRVKSVKVKMFQGWPDYQTFKIQKHIPGIFTVMSPNKMFKFSLTKIRSNWFNNLRYNANDDNWSIATLDNNIDVSFTYKR